MSKLEVRPMRVRPRPIVGIVIFVVYAAIFSVGFLVLGVDYDAVGDTTSNVMRAIVVPVPIRLSMATPAVRKKADCSGVA